MRFLCFGSLVVGFEWLVLLADIHNREGLIMSLDDLKRRMRIRFVPKDEEDIMIRSNDPLMKEVIERFERDHKDIHENYPRTARFRAEEAKRRFEEAAKPHEPLTPEEEQWQKERLMWAIKRRFRKAP